MNTTSSQLDSRSIRFGFASVIFGMSYLNVRCAFGLDTFRHIYHDMLNGKPLPSTTEFVLTAQPYLIGLSILIPSAALILMFTPATTRSTYILGVLILAVFFQLFFTWQAVSAPLFEITTTMQAG